jgi:hypothetical protein
MSPARSRMPWTPETGQDRPVSPGRGPGRALPCSVPCWSPSYSRFAILCAARSLRADGGRLRGFQRATLAPPRGRVIPKKGSRSKLLSGRRRAPRSCSVNPHVIPARGAPVPKSRAVHTPDGTAAISGTPAVLRGFRPASRPTATTRDRGRLSLLATVRQEVLGVSGDPDVGQQRLPVPLLLREGSQSSRDVAHGSIRCCLAPAKMLERIAAVSPP